jgi:C1A family cysteine protease
LRALILIGNFIIRYNAVQKNCTAPHKPVARISGYGFITRNNNESAMMSFLVNEGPPSVAVDAQIWHYYKGGVITRNCGQSLNHAVQLVGYDTIDNIPVWIVRNSWGADWGINGYIYVKRGANVCGIGNYVISSKV